MAISSWRSNIRTGLVILGAGLICTYLYTKAMEKSPSPKPELKINILGTTVKAVNNSIKLSVVNTSISEGECLWIKPWFIRPVSRFKHAQMTFFSKPIMQSLKTIATTRHWNFALISNDSTAGLSRLHKYTSMQNLFTIVVTSSRFYKHFEIQDLSYSKNALVSAIRYAFKITGGKKGQLIAFREHFSKYGCNLDTLDVMPRSFLLDNPKECLQFFKYADKDPDSWWVLKESSGYGGTGVTIHSNLTRLYNDFSLCSNTKEFIVQKYLPDPLLLNKRKFDIRGLVLIASTDPYFLFHHNGYLRVSMKQFSPDGGKEAHITNSHIQVNAENYSPNEHLWSFERFQSYLDENMPDNNGFVKNRLIPFIEKTALFILQTGKGVFERAPSSYQLLGLDFMVTSDLRVWFIEANNYPLWPTGSKRIDHFMNAMGNSMFDLLFALRETPLEFVTMKPGAKYKSWELIWNELNEKCSNKFYSPCDIFKL